MAAYRLALRGLYDESLCLTRNIAEIANLVALFWQEPDSLSEWQGCPDGKTRWDKFNPSKVRKRLEGGGKLLPVEEKLYSHLSQVAVHFRRDTLPGSHNEHGMPVLGGIVQERGLHSAISRLAEMVAIVAGPVGKLAILPEERTKELVAASISLLESVPKEREED